MRDVVTTVGELVGAAAVAVGSAAQFGWAVGLIVAGVLMVFLSAVAGADRGAP